MVNEFGDFMGALTMIDIFESCIEGAGTQPSGQDGGEIVALSCVYVF